MSKRTMSAMGWAVVITLIGVTITTQYALRAYRDYHSLSTLEHAERRAPDTLRDWMTVDYLSKRYAIEPRAFFIALGLDPMLDPKLALGPLIERYALDPERAYASVQRMLELHQQSSADERPAT